MLSFLLCVKTLFCLFLFSLISFLVNKEHLTEVPQCSSLGKMISTSPRESQLTAEVGRFLASFMLRMTCTFFGAFSENCLSSYEARKGETSAGSSSRREL